MRVQDLPNFTFWRVHELKTNECAKSEHVKHEILRKLIVEIDVLFELNLVIIFLKERLFLY